MLSLFIVALYALAAVGAGNVLCRAAALRGEVNRRLADPVSLQFAAGSAVLASLWELMALGGILRPAFEWPILIACLAIAIGSAYKNQRITSHKWHPLFAGLAGKWSLLLVVALTAGVVTWFG